MKSNNTKQHNFTEGVMKNVTNSRLDNVEEQTAPSSAMIGGLIALVCFGFFFVLAIVAIFGKKLFETWQRRHYSRIDYLVNGMYN
uniref:Uncharacterized protein n=1 Tax=Magallana gigas TaxID=29159 RepID=A0A8W8JHB9_MAGGI